MFFSLPRSLSIFRHVPLPSLPSLSLSLPHCPSDFSLLSSLSLSPSLPLSL